jgi:hypothetical protein
MSIATLILGDSGAGKTTSLRNLDPAKTLLIQTLKKSLPFRSKDWMAWDSQAKTGSIFCSDNSSVITRVINAAPAYGKEIIIIDDFQYLMVNEFMREAETKGFDKFTLIGKHAWEVVEAATKLPENIRTYFLSHSVTDDSGKIRAKTIGKMLDDKIVLEGMFPNVIRTEILNDEHVFITKCHGRDTVKLPMGMIKEDTMPNDLAMLDAIICEFEGIEDKVVSE